MSSAVLQPVETVTQTEYPSADGKPVAESDYQLIPLTCARDGLRHYFRRRPDVYVAGNLLIYTQQEDQGRKRTLYRRLRVAEYWQYDPTGDYLAPPLRGMTLAAGAYVALPERRLPDGALSVRSEALGLEVRAGAWGLRFHDAATGRNVMTLAETDEARERAERGWRREQEARRAAEARVAELEALLRAKGVPQADRGAASTA